MKRPENVAKASKGKGVASCPDADLVKRYPNLIEYLTVTEFEDGSSRERSVLSVFVEDGRVKVCLNDKELERSGYVSGDTLTGVLVALEKALATEGLEWRPWGGKKRK